PHEIGIRVIAGELLSGNAVHGGRPFLLVACLAKVANPEEAQSKARCVLPAERPLDLWILVVETVAATNGGRHARTEALGNAGAHGESFHTIEADKIRQPSR